MSKKTYDASKVKVSFNGRIIEGMTTEWQLHGEPIYTREDLERSTTFEGSGTLKFSEENAKALRDLMAEIERYAHWLGQWVTAWDLIGMEVYQRAANQTANQTAEPCWAVLGIPPGSSERDIKRAYARLVRQHPPERDAEAFQRVRLAYEEALNPHGEELSAANITDQFYDEMTGWVFETATGKWLDHWGDLLGVKRETGETDADYRKRVNVRAKYWPTPDYLKAGGP